MKCSRCGLHHPPQYEICVSCGEKLSAADPQIQEAAGQPVVATERSAASDFEIDKPPESLRRSKNFGRQKTGFPTSLGILLAVAVLLISAGATIFFLTKPPDDKRLYEQGQKELANGQYAFAVKTLNQAVALKPKDGRGYLSLARAYVGIDQVEKAWDCINQAQQLGAGLVAEPALASDLANYYRQRGKYERAMELLRPLAKADVAGKKAELADLDALWGDESLRAGNVEQALRCWEEVRDLHDGSRFIECDARLATIYQKLATSSESANDDTKALRYLNKLNSFAQNAHNYDMAADIYARTGQLELAIDQLRQAIKLSQKNPVLDKKLSDLLTRRGKELLDQGNADAGYGYLQQAKDMNGHAGGSSIALKNVDAAIDFSTHMPQINGEVWNPTDKSINSLTLKVELFDNATARILWSNEQKIVDSFVPPLSAKESKPFAFISDTAVRANGASEFRVYIDGTLYNSYPIGAKDKSATKADGSADQRQSLKSQKPNFAERNQAAVQKSSSTNTPLYTTPSSLPTTSPNNIQNKGSSAEEKTMKDLEP